MSDNFYRAFEDLHRGSRDLIRKRQEIYLPFISPLKGLYPQCPALDLGCGRGEWLELIRSEGFLARGVDLDEGMLQACQALDLPAEYGDALAALAALGDESQVVVSAFHLVEHIPFAILQQLVSEALRVLKPAGLLIMETPNPENLSVGTNSFYLDPTHEKPIPHLLLSFLTEYTGFARSKLVRLQESDALHDAPKLTLMDVLDGVSPDYAIIAQKTAAVEQLAAFDPYFDRAYGLSLETLAERYEEHMERRFRATLEDSNLQQIQQLKAIRHEVAGASTELQRQSAELSAQLQRQCVELSAELQRQSIELSAELQRQDVELESNSPRRSVGLEAKSQHQIVELEAELQKTRQQRDEALAHAHEIWLQSCANSSRVQALMSSTSWRLTAPLRWCARSVLWLCSSVAHLPKIGPRRIVVVGLRHTLGRPGLRRLLNASLKRYPRLYGALKRFALNRGLVAGASVYRHEARNSEIPEHLEGLSAGARQVYYDLKRTTEQENQR